MRIRSLLKANIYFYSKQDLSVQYETYDAFIQNYKKQGNNIKPFYVKKLLYHAKPKISRQNNYVHQLIPILSNCIAHFKQNSKTYKESNLISTILNLYQSLNLHRKELFDIAESLYPDLRIENNFVTFLFIYQCMIDLHEKNHLQFKSRIQQFLIDGIRSQNFQEKYKLKGRSFQMSLRILKSMMLDEQLNRAECQQLLSYIQTKIFPKVENVNFTDKLIGSHLGILKQLIKLYGLQITNDKFEKTLQLALKYQISQKNQQHKDVIKHKNFQVAFSENNIIESSEEKEQKNQKVIHFGQSSVFQTVFSRILQEKGYDFDKNVILGMFQYDALVKGKKSKTYFPFKNIHKGSKQPFKPISQQEWIAFKNMNDLDKVAISEKFQNPVILNLNGPFHYIDSDVYGGERVTRTEQIKYKILQNYGIKKFSTIHYLKWQQVHQQGVGIQQFIEEALDRNELKNL